MGTFTALTGIRVFLPALIPIEADNFFESTAVCLRRVGTCWCFQKNIGLNGNAGKKTRIPVKAAKVPKMRQIEYIYEYMETSYTEVIFSS